MKRSGEQLESRWLHAADLIGQSAEDQAVINIGAACPAEPTVEVSAASTPSATSARWQDLPGVVYEQAAEGNPLDLNQDGRISPLDADTIFEELNKRHLSATAESSGFAEQTAIPSQSYDVNSDGQVTALDALRIVNRLNFYNGLVPCNCAQCLATLVAQR